MGPSNSVSITWAVAHRDTAAKGALNQGRIFKIPQYYNLVQSLIIHLEGNILSPTDVAPQMNSERLNQIILLRYLKYQPREQRSFGHCVSV